MHKISSECCMVNYGASVLYVVAIVTGSHLVSQGQTNWWIIPARVFPHKTSMVLFLQQQLISGCGSMKNN